MDDFCCRGNIVKWLQNRKERTQGNQLLFRKYDYYPHPYILSRGKVDWISRSFYYLLMQCVSDVCSCLQSFFKK